MHGVHTVYIAYDVHIAQNESRPREAPPKLRVYIYIYIYIFSDNVICIHIVLVLLDGFYHMQGILAATVHSVNVSGSISVGLFLHQNRSLLPYAGNFSGDSALGQR